MSRVNMMFPTHIMMCMMNMMGRGWRGLLKWLELLNWFIIPIRLGGLIHWKRGVWVKRLDWGDMN
jgi:hypothetical protein